MVDEFVQQWINDTAEMDKEEFLVETQTLIFELQVWMDAVQYDD